LAITGGAEMPPGWYVLASDSLCTLPVPIVFSLGWYPVRAGP
jgi:hypothetical protein